MLGAGAFGIPAAFAATGMGGGIFLMLLVAAIGIFTLLILTMLVNTLNQQSYQGVITHTLGKRVSFGAQCLILAYTFGSCVVFLQIARDNMGNIVQHFGGFHWYTDPRFLITIFTCVIPGPLSFLRNMAKLSYPSTFGVLFVLYAAVFIIVDGIIYLINEENAPHIIHGFTHSITYARGFPTIVFAFMTHVGFPPIAAELINPTLLRSGAVVASSFIMCIFLYFGVGIIAYMRIGSYCFESIINPHCIERFPYLAVHVNQTIVPGMGNVLNIYDPSYIPAIIARFGLCITLGMGYPLSLFVGRITVKTLFNHNREFGNLAHFLVTFVWIVGTLALTVGLQSINIVFNFIGSTAGAWFMMVFPALMFIASYKGELFLSCRPLRLKFFKETFQFSLEDPFLLSEEQEVRI